MLASHQYTELIDPMHISVKSLVCGAVFTAGLPVCADLWYFSYTFDASVRGTAGNQLTGVVEGTLSGDGDTIAISSFESLSLGGFDYEITPTIGGRGHLPDSPPLISLSGETLDLWVCVQGFTGIFPGLGGDCPFGAEGGFLLIGDYQGSPSGFFSPSLAWAGIPELGTSYRDGDRPLEPGNWFATRLATDLEPVAAAEVGAILSDCAAATNPTNCSITGFNNLLSSGAISGRQRGALQSDLAGSGNKGEKP